MPSKPTPLKDLVICVCGNFGKGRSREQMKTWIEINGGKYVTTLTDEVTHVVCSEDQFKLDNKLIQDAHLRDKVTIVTYDWLEDSIIARRKLGTKKYEWVKILKEKSKQKVARKKSESKKLKKDAEAFHDGVEAAKNDINSDNYHVYRDPGSGVDFALVLARVEDINSAPERVFLRMYESNTEPAKYATCFKQILPTMQVIENIVAPIGSNFETAFREFREHFKDLTHVDWNSKEMARIHVGVMPTAQKFIQMNGQSVTEIPFVWLPSHPMN